MRRPTMRSYLDLIPISAKVRRRQNRMTLLCIIISVFLVTAVFCVADMLIRANSEFLQKKHGYWHLRIQGISREIAGEIEERPDVAFIGWRASFNEDADQPYEIDGKKAALYGVDDSYLTGLVNALEEGGTPRNDGEVMLSSNAKLALDVQTGDLVTLHTPAGDTVFTVSGFGSDDKGYFGRQTYLVPEGLILGTLVSWGICAYMRYGIGGEFASMEVFGISSVGLLSGVLVGVVTVLLAAQSPAKRAARVSPVAAVSGNSEVLPGGRCGIKRKVGRIERTLGIHHAITSKRNWFLMTASFALTIVLILCFSIGLDFAEGLLPSLKSWQPDITLNGYGNAPVLEQRVKEEIAGIRGVRRVFGTAYRKGLPAVSSRQGIDHIHLESYDEYLLESIKDEVVEGDLSDI